MAIDASIPLHGLLINRNDENLKQDQHNQYLMQQQNQRRLGDLLPQAMSGDKTAMGQIAAINPQLYLQLDASQREAVHNELDDMGAAVRWATSDPAQQAARWNQVIDYYGQKHPQVLQYRDHPEMAGQALMQLGQMSEFLKAQHADNPPSSVQEYEYAKGQGYGGSYMDYRNQMGSPLVVDNGDGTKTIYPHGFGGGQAPQQNVPPPPPGFVIEGGQTGSAPSGGFP